jgi:hypothetical protein
LSELAVWEYFSLTDLILVSFRQQILTSTCAAISNVANDYENIGVLTDYGVVPLLANMTYIVCYSFY